MRRTLPAAIVALLVAGSTALLWRVAAPSTTRHPLSDLAQAVGGSLPFEARLTGGFAPSDGSSVRRADSSAAAPLSPDARIAIALIEKRAAAEDTQEAQAALGVAYLVSGDTDSAISMLDDATAMGEAAGPWSDLSAAYLVKAERAPTRRVEYFARALEAASRSIRLAPSNEARFNLALARKGLAPYVGGGTQWQEYLAAEADERWRAAAARNALPGAAVEDARERWIARERELRVRLARRDSAFVEETTTEFPEAVLEHFGEVLVAWAKASSARDSRTALARRSDAELLAKAIRVTTGDALPQAEVISLAKPVATLARAHLDYADGVAHYSSGDYEKAMAALSRARIGFAAAHSPYVNWAETQLATIEFQRRDLVTADRRLARIESLARQAGYQTLLGRVLWLRGLVHAKAWRLTEAITAFRAAAACFEAADESEFAVSIYNVLADTLRTLGEIHESWRYIGQTLHELHRVRSPVRRYLALYNAALFAASQELFEAALLFQNAAVDQSATAGPAPGVESLIARAVVQISRKDRSAAAADLRLARAKLATIPAGPQQDYHRAEIEALAASVPETPHDSAAAEGLGRAIRFFTKTEPARVPRLYLALARVYQARGDRPSQENALATGISALEAQQGSLSDEALKISYFDEAWSLFQDMLELHTARPDPAKALTYAERSRARLLLASTTDGAARPLDVADIQRRLPDSVVLLYYVTLTDRLLIWTISRDTLDVREEIIASREMARLVTRHRTGLIDGRFPAAENERLFEVLLGPSLSDLPPRATVAVAPDGALQLLSFATLKNPVTRRFLIEDHAILIVPSASFLLERTTGSAQAWASALLVGNPDTGAPPLPGAEREVAAVGTQYGERQVLLGAAATRERFVSQAANYDVVHFGGHAYVNTEFPLLSRLAFAESTESESSTLFAHEISRMRFHRTGLVVLAACSTAAGAVSRGEGVISIARPFLAAGVPLAIASQWDVDDRATESLFVEFHRALSASHAPLAALQAAQVAMLRSPIPSLAAPASWGAFVALGAAIH